VNQGDDMHVCHICVCGWVGVCVRVCVCVQGLSLSHIVFATASRCFSSLL